MLLATLCIGHAEGREILDMAGRRVSVPDAITKAYGATPPATYMIYALDPGLLAGLNYPFAALEKRYLKPSVASLPVIGGWFGQGRTPNLETLLAVRPEVMVGWIWPGQTANEKIEQVAGQLRMPLFYIRLDTLTDYPEAFRSLGDLLRLEKRAEELSDYASRAIQTIVPVAAAIPDEEKVSVYYAEAPDGLSSECDRSPHAELINLAGGRNVYRCAPKNDFGMERISIEQVMAADPEVILAQEKEFADHVYDDPRWRHIRAVKNRRVHLIPKAPFNWFDRPPSFMRLLGVKWLANVLYPERFPLDLSREIGEFYDLFLGLKLDERELAEVLRH
ncbi:MAG: ABC transporter substrate-binding protein [Desulfobacteraceae bacterium]|nr:ABC transporter substrate-binding protein [Desulfobacteraceae bacterium]